MRKGSPNKEQRMEIALISPSHAFCVTAARRRKQTQKGVAQREGLVSKPGVKNYKEF